jgi:DNA-directed RNA polymerase specialized sigma subunit
MPNAKTRDLDSAAAEIHEDTTEHDETIEWLDGLEPEATAADNTEDLARVGEAALSLAHDEQTLEDAIRVAREHGRSWTEIALRLGVSRQAARQRYGARVGV